MWAKLVIFFSLKKRRWFDRFFWKWDNVNNVIIDRNRFGIQPNMVTTGAISCLSSVISMSLRKMKKITLLFHWFEKAFDTVERLNVGKNFLMYVIKGKLSNNIRSMYNYIDFCVKTPRMLSDFFENSLVFFKGTSWPPFCFLILCQCSWNEFH